jgi:CDP-diacylglycerol pyrophosphatase
VRTKDSGDTCHTYARIYVCMHVCMHENTYLHIKTQRGRTHTHTHIHIHPPQIREYISMNITRVYTCRYVFMYKHTRGHTQADTELESE